MTQESHLRCRRRSSARKLDRLQQGEDIKKGLIGIVVKSEDPYDSDTELAAVRTRSPAEAAGLKPGDEIVSVAGRKCSVIKKSNKFSVDSMPVNRSRLNIDVIKKTQLVEVTLADSIPPLEPQRLGIVVRQQVGEDEQKTAVDR